MSLIIPKSDTKTVEKVKAAIQAAYEEGQGKLKGNGRIVPKLETIKNPPVTEIWNGLGMIPTRTATSLMPILPQSPAS